MQAFRETNRQEGGQAVRQTNSDKQQAGWQAQTYEGHFLCFMFYELVCASTKVKKVECMFIIVSPLFKGPAISDL